MEVREANRKEAVLFMDQMTRLPLSHKKLYLEEHGRLHGGTKHGVL